MSMNTIQAAPSSEVLSAFGLPTVTPRLLADGSGMSWSVAGAILKPALDPLEAQWTAELYAGLPEQGFRVPRPLRTATGSYLQDGWCAWKFISGSHHNAGDWPALLACCIAFHTALAGIDPPGFLAMERHHWALADRIAWGEERPGPRWSLLAAITELQAQLDDADRRLPRQLIHGDFTGNLLYAQDLAPAVIDFSPFWRPAAYAMAIALADALAWHNAPDSLFDEARSHGVTDSLIRRAVIFRLAACCASPDSGIDDRLAERQAYGKVLKLIDS
jgi:uncharacterized protein (TIGR02569 family)